MRAILLACLLGCGDAWALEAGAPMPPLAAPALDDAAQPVSLAATRGDVVYVDFWASWCGPCKISMPVLEAMQQKYGKRGFRVIGVNKDVSVADARRFLRQVPVGFTLVHDGGDKLARAFDVKAMPSGYLVDRRGVVRYVHRGFTSESEAALQREVSSLLEEAP